MKMIRPLILKFIMIMAVLWIVLGLYGVSFINILLTSVVLTGVSFIGDLFILPKIGNVAATIADFGLAFVMIWLLGSALFTPSIRIGMASLVSAAIITVGEYLFHKYLQKQIFTEEKISTGENLNSYNQQNMQTEFGLENDIKKPIKKPKHQKSKKLKKKNPY